MPFLDFATAHPSFQNHIYALSSQSLFSGKFIFSNERRLAFAWKSLQIPKKAKGFNFGPIQMRQSGLIIKAVATLEPTCFVQNDDRDQGYHDLQLGLDSRSPPMVEHQSSGEESVALEEREKLRRMRISKANKGNTPWNKGKKHSPETRQRIRERTRLAMQDPKVKMKLVNLGHAQSPETRIKIGAGVRMGWERRREKMMLQETCYFEWQNLIAEASRRGFVGEEELQWDSYEILDKQLEQEWLESVERRKKLPRPKGSKRAPKSAEQRRKISEAISAKWADPEYRDRVCSALAKYHDIPAGVKRKPTRKRSGDEQSRYRSPTRKKANETENSSWNETKIQKQLLGLKRSNVPLYRDPLASSKLEMIKNIRAQRATTDTKRTEAIARAKLLIAEAEKAAKALEVAAMRSPVARDSLIETRKLIAEAIQSIKSIETGEVDSHDNDRCLTFTSTGLVNNVEKEADVEIRGLSQTDQKEINGMHVSASSESESESESDIKGFDFGKFTLQDLLNGKDKVLPTGSSEYGLVNGKEELHQTRSSYSSLSSLELDDMITHSGFGKQLGQFEPNGSTRHVEKKQNLLPNGAKFESRKEETKPNSITRPKKWVRGRLVEVGEGE